MNIKSKYSAFLSLVNMGIGHMPQLQPQIDDWTKIRELSEQHGLTAIVMDGIAYVPEDHRPSKSLLLQWIGEVSQNFENRYEMYSATIGELAKFYNAHDIKMMVLKGYACSLDWPKPNHRPCGDIDIWQFGHYREADALIEKEKGIKVDTSHHHHTVFNWGLFPIENHYDFINIHHHRSNRKMELLLKELGKDDSCYTELYGQKIYLPSPKLHALFLLKHMMMHFASEAVSLRQLLDWAFFIEKHGRDVDWEWFESLLKHFGMMELYGIFNAICVADLGFDARLFSYVQFNPDLKDRVMKEILEPEYGAKLPKGLIRRIEYKCRRWKANEWKHQLCYTESMLEAFFSGLWNHILKPSSI